MNKITFLDCTLRDGGYYTDWDFNLDKAKQLIEGLNKAGVDIIELGYKAPYSQKKYFGLFRNCNEDYLTFVSKHDRAEYAFMIDVKEFLNGEEINYELLNLHIRDSAESIFSWVRLASHYPTIWAVPELTRYFRDKGYKVTLNLMGGSLLSNDDLRVALRKAEEAAVDVFYIADSFGAFYPEDIQKLINFIKSVYPGKIGIHTHDNQGLAYVNTIAAINENVEYVDGTVCGMGRGAGNLATEQFLLGYSHKNNDERFNSAALLPSIASFIEPLKARYKWGFHYSYMFSGLMNIHPTYCQQLSEGDRYTLEETHGILKSIPKEHRSKFKKEVLDKAIEGFLNAEVAGFSVETNKIFDTNLLSNESILIIARGQQALNNITGLLNLADRLHIPIIECNFTGFLPHERKRYLVILNQNKIKRFIEQAEYPNIFLISGQPVNNGKLPFENAFFPISLGKLKIDDNQLYIPDYDAGLYAIALAMKAGVKNILLAGFDGFEDPDINAGREVYFSQFATVASEKGIKLMLVTPSKYKSIDQGSLYTL